MAVVARPRAVEQSCAETRYFGTIEYHDGVNGRIRSDDFEKIGYCCFRYVQNPPIKVEDRVSFVLDFDDDDNPIAQDIWLGTRVTTPDGANLHTGTVKWFNAPKGYGFIIPDGGGEDVFVHYSVILMDGFKELFEGDRVSFEAIRGDKGQKAQNAVKLNEPTSKGVE